MTQESNRVIADYLPYYLGCKLVSNNTHGIVGTLVGVVKNDVYFKSNGFIYHYKADMYKPILRPLSSMTEEKRKELYAMGSQRYKGGITQMLNLNCFDSAQFMWLLINHFDLFNLIESNLAIDAETIKK